MEKESGMRKSNNIWTRLCLAAAAVLALFLVTFSVGGPALAAAAGAAVFRAQAPDGTRIVVSAPEGTFAEGTTLSVSAVGSQSVSGAFDAAGVGCDGVCAYELSWKDAQGAAVAAPDAGYSVTIELGAGALPASADASSASARMVSNGRASGAHTLTGGAASFEAAQLGTLAVTYANAEEPAPAAAEEAVPAAEEAPAAAEEAPAEEQAPAEETAPVAASEAVAEEPAETAGEEAAETSGVQASNSTDGAAAETKADGQDASTQIASKVEEADPAAENAAADEMAEAPAGGTGNASAAQAPADSAESSAAGASEDSGSSAAKTAGLDAVTVLPADSLAGEDENASEAGTEADETSAAAKSAPAAFDEEDEESPDAADPGTSAADDTAAISSMAAAPAASVAAAPAAGMTRVYLYVYLDSLPTAVQNHLSSHSVHNGTMWVTVGYIDVPSSVLPTAQQGNVRKGYIFNDTYEPLIAAGSSVKYTIHYYTPNYGNGSGTQVDKNSYYQQIEAYINWNQLGLCVADGADDYVSETGSRPAWHLDGHYTYSEKTLKVEKSVTGNFGDKEREYGFTATYAKPDGVRETISFTLSDGESRLISVPTTTSITVTENSYSGDGYTTTVTHASTTASGRSWSTNSLEADTTITFTNHRTITPDVGTDLASEPYLAVLAGASAFGILFFVRTRKTQG